MKLKTRPAGLIFDLDGTLADTLPQLALAASQACEAAGLKAPTLEQAKSFVGNGVTLLLSRAIVGSRKIVAHTDPITLASLAKADVANISEKALSENVQVHEVTPEDIDPALLREVRANFDKFYTATLHENFTLYSGVKEGLSYFKQSGIKLAVCTNKPQMFALPLLKYMGISQYFDFILGGEVLSRRKPDPSPVLYVCGRLGLYPWQCAMIGDSENDVFAAQNAQMSSVFLSYGYFTGDPATINPDYEFDNFNDFMALISNLKKDY